MPPALLAAIPAVIGAGTAVYGASQQKKAANSALDAQNQASQQQLAAQEAARQQQVQLNQPFVQGGYSALDAIMRTYGLGPSGASPPAARPAAAPAAGGALSGAGGGSPSGGFNPAGLSPYSGDTFVDPRTGLAPGQGAPGAGSGGADPAKPPGGASYNYGASPGGATGPFQGTLPDPSGQPAPAGPAPGSPDWAAYAQANPDIRQYYDQTPEAQTVPFEQFLQQTAEQQKDVRNPPTLVPEAGPATTTSNGYVPVYDRPDQPEWQGAGAAPSQADFLDPSKFTTSPGYEFRLNEGNRNVNASFGAKGLLKSGAALKGFDDYNQGTASNEYGNWFNQQNSLYQSALGQYNQDRSANYNIFNTERNNTNQNFADDRSYGTNLGLTNRSYDTQQENTRVGNLFSLLNTGQSAANTTGAAAQNYANSAGNIYGSQANAAADAAAARAGANAGAVGTIGGIGANLFNSYQPAANSNTSGQVNLGSLNYGNIFSGTPRVVSF